MNKKVIAIISVLKPVDDTRNYEKIATSLGNTNKYDINIIGFRSKNIPSTSAITFHPEFDFDRISTKRLFASFKIWQIFIKLKPELIIVTCAELLAVTCLYRILFGCRIIYDVQENYCRNILYSGAYPALLKYPTAALVRLLEYITSPFIHTFFLAELIYARQLHFIGNRYLVLENKAVLSIGLEKPLNTQGDPLRFLFCGTITRHYGALEAINFFHEWRKVEPQSEMYILGHAPDKLFFSEIQQKAIDIPSIHIIGNGDLVPHQDILKEMKKASFVLMPYHSGCSVKGRIPTKLYECLAMEIPVIISPDEVWSALIDTNNAGIIHDFREKLSEEFFHKINNSTFYGNKSADYYLWTSCETALINQIQTSINN